MKPGESPEFTGCGPNPKKLTLTLLEGYFLDQNPGTSELLHWIMRVGLMQPFRARIKALQEKKKWLREKCPPAFLVDGWMKLGLA